MIRIAMWSGPRNISTAMMRAWENRKDTVVVDEPFYGPYLAATGKQHPHWKETIEAQGDNHASVVHSLCHDQKPAAIFYQKHMTHHILPGMDVSFIRNFRNAFLLRHPIEVLSSYLEKEPQATPEDLGFPQQVQLFDFIKKELGVSSPVIESKDVLIDPEATLRCLCQALDVPFDEAMLSWPKGQRDSDGVWAAHWYNRVVESTGFAPYRAKENRLTAKQKAVADACLPYYESLVKHKLK